MDKSQGFAEIPCKFCGRGIIESNYELHIARCQMMTSRARFQAYSSPSQKQQLNQLASKYEGHKNEPKKKDPQIERKKIFNKKMSEQEKIPCPKCGYQQTLAELDTHPKECAFREQQCPYCSQSFPEGEIMQQHQEICNQRIENQQRQRIPSNHIHHEPQYFEDEFEEEEDDDFPHPFGNLSFFNRSRGAPNSFQRRIFTINGRTIIQESDGRGGLIRRQTFNSRQPAPQFPQMHRGERLFRNNNGGSSPFHNFFRLLEMMAGGQSQLQVGLTEQQLKNLKKIKYQPGTNNGQDLCTICYCNFEKNEKIIELKCKHIYHEECIVKWLEKNAKCPVCKQPQTNRQILQEE